MAKSKDKDKLDVITDQRGVATSKPQGNDNNDSNIRLDINNDNTGKAALAKISEVMSDIKQVIKYSLETVDDASAFISLFGQFIYNKVLEASNAITHTIEAIGNGIKVIFDDGISKLVKKIF